MTYSTHCAHAKIYKFISLCGMEELFLEVYGFEGMWMHVHVFLILKFVNVTSNSEGEARARTY